MDHKRRKLSHTKNQETLQETISERVFPKVVEDIAPLVDKAKRRLRSSVDEINEQIVSMVRNHPIRSIATGFALGYLLAFLIPRSKG